MTTTSTNHSLVGTGNGRMTLTEGPRQGEHERVRLIFLPDGVIVGAGEIPVERDQLPPRLGRTLSASGGRHVYGPSGELLVTNRADLHATRTEAA